MTKVERLREKTYKEAVSLLQQYGKCAIIRPTGFGKTGILTRFIRSRKYSKILYLYPADVIKNTVLNFYYKDPEDKKDYIPNVIFMTYAKLTQLNEKDEELLEGTDLIICDECHRLGAPETMEGIYQLFSLLPNAHILGATATPERMDMIDEIAMFFDDHMTSKYTLHDAFQDEIIKRPYYCFCAYGESDPKVLARIKRDSRIELEKITDENDRRYASELLKSRFIEIAKLQKMDYVISETLKEVNADTVYQKYIVFFKSFDHMKKNAKKVRSWFKKAFPNHTINEVTITSETYEYHNNVGILDSLVYQENSIDLIYTCDMLNMGYHVDNLTGILMYRGTYSSTVYMQQLGRALSTGDSVPKIVFDIVDNIHRKSVYSTLENNNFSTTLTESELEEYTELIKRTGDKDENGNPVHLTKEETKRFIELSRKFKKVRDKNDCKVNDDLYKSDLIVTKYAATYKELIAKTVAEPISMRCRQAWARWLEKGGDDSIMTKEYILGQIPPEHVPLPPFCKLKNVTVNAVLEEMGIV